ncbi:MAG: hypothetical protein ACKOOL_04650 [Novosphingobium sp.]
MTTAIGVLLALASCSGGSLSVRAKAPDRVLVRLESESYPGTMTIWKVVGPDKAASYFEGTVTGKFPIDGKMILPRDFALFDNAKTGPGFDPARFPKGTYTIDFFVNAEHAFQTHFQIS